MNLSITDQILAKLSSLEATHACQIIFAAESGSRAWGFPSETSDYDVRCIYVHPREKYLGILPLRDTIEWELNEVYDIKGWDLRKTLLLALRSNISVFEWADSPIVYRTSPWLEEFRAVTRRLMQPVRLASRYLGMADSSYKRYLTVAKPIYKEYFYAIRPLLAARWVLKEHTPAPMLFSDLCAAMLPRDMQGTVNELLTLRTGNVEKAYGAPIPEALSYIQREMATLRRQIEALPFPSPPDSAEADAFFRRIVTGDLSSVGNHPL